MSTFNECECCKQPNAWTLIDPDYKYVCLPCVENGTLKVCISEGVYRRQATCGCGRIGAVNYDDDRYYCGSSPSCCP